MNNLYFESVFDSQHLIQLCQQSYDKVVLISDEQVAKHYAARLQATLQQANIALSILTFPAGEASKTRAMKATLEDRLFALGCGRNSLLIAMGGGVTTDLVGFVAATFNRGIPVIYIPTSLLAMVDAAIGGKTGINTPYGKNLLGTFSEPLATFIDVSLLATLPDDHYRDAFAEIIKHALIADHEYFQRLKQGRQALKARDETLLKQVIQQSCAIKCQIVQQDKNEAGLRKILNAGHTIAHALEHCADYSLAHGQAVAIGLVMESALACHLGYLEREVYEEIKQLLINYELPTTLPTDIDSKALMDALHYDKKNHRDEIHFVLLQAIGEVYCPLAGVTVAVSEKLIQHLSQSFLNC